MSREVAIRRLVERYCRIVEHQIGVKVRPYRTRGVDYFSNLSDSRKADLILTLRVQCKLFERGRLKQC